MLELLNSFFPRRCLICRNELSALSRSTNSTASKLLCRFCDPTATALSADNPATDIVSKLTKLELRPHCARCGTDITRYPGGPLLCVSCTLWPPPFNTLRSGWTYGGEIEALLKAYKYHQKRKLDRYFAQIFMSMLRELAQEIEADCRSLLIVPMPSSASAIQQRGFCHMVFIARRLAELSGLKFSSKALFSLGDYRNQAQLAPAERFANMRGRFGGKASLVHGENILLLDDVVTTGATIWNASWALTSAGASAVHVLTISRSGNFHSLRLASNSKVEQIGGIHRRVNVNGAV